MKISFTFILTLFYFTYSYEENEENSIIKIPNKDGRFKNITTKNGFINYSFISRSDENICNMVYITYVLEGIKNLNLFQLPNKTLNFEYNIYGKNKDNLELIFLNEEKDIYNPLLCEIFYKTKYIDKMVYSLGKNIFNQPFKFFGGTPHEISKNLNKFTFNNITNKITEIKIELNNGSNYIINNINNELVEFKQDEFSMICLPEDILLKLKNIFLNKYEECTYNYKLFSSISAYKLNNKQKNLYFPEISFKIGNKFFILNKENAFFPNYEQENIYLFINRSPCRNFIFGQKFFELFDVSEYNLETGEINLYLNKKKNYIIDETENKKIIINYNFHFIITIIFFFIFLMILTLMKNYYKNKNIEYYDYYFNI